MTIRLARRAVDDIEGILAYLGERSVLAERRVARAIFAAIDRIEEFPTQGRLSGQQATRVIQAGRYPYLIYWHVVGQDAWIVHVRHAARQPWRGGED